MFLNCRDPSSVATGVGKVTMMARSATSGMQAKCHKCDLFVGVVPRLHLTAVVTRDLRLIHIEGMDPPHLISGVESNFVLGGPFRVWGGEGAGLLLWADFFFSWD